MLWRQAFYNPSSFATDELIEKKLELASLPGAQAAFLKTLRGFVEFRGFRPGPVAELRSSLPNIHTPCLVVWGANDQLVPPSHAKVLKEVMPNIEVQIWEQCGYVPQIECAERFNRSALAFWYQVDEQVSKQKNARDA